MNEARCPIPLPNGNDCWNEPHPDSKQGLCAQHWQEVANAWFTTKETAGALDAPKSGILQRYRCPACEQLTVMRPTTEGQFQCSNPTCMADAARRQRA